MNARICAPRSWNWQTIAVLALLLAALVISYGTDCKGAGEHWQAARILDDFEGAAQGIWWDQDGTSVYRRSVVAGKSISGRRAMEIEYDKGVLPWSFFAFHLDDLSRERSTFSELVFWVLSPHEIEILVRAEGSSGSFNEEFVLIPPNEWTSVSISVLGDGLGRLTDLLWFIAPGQERETGNLLLDCIALASRDLAAFHPIPATSRLVDLQTAAESSVSRVLTWSLPILRTWEGLYEVQVDTDPSFGTPLSYLVSESPRLALEELPPGLYHWKVRLISHFPRELGFWGQEGEWSSIATFSIRAPETVRFLDGFERKSPFIETWWDGNSSAVYRRRSTEAITHSGVMAMQIDYEKTAGYEWAFFAAKLNPQGASDWHEFDAMVFWLYSPVPNAEILVKLEDGAGKLWEAPILVGSSSEWMLGSLDLRRAAASIDLATLSNLYFFLAPGHADTSGSLVMDDLAIVRRVGEAASPTQPVLSTPIALNQYSTYLTWTDESTSGASLYEIRESCYGESSSATTYLTVSNELVTTRRESGAYTYSVRAWTGLPEYGGVSSLWSTPKQSANTGDAPPVIETVTSYYVDNTTGEYTAGCVPRIVVYEAYRAADVVGGNVDISGADFDGQLSLTKSENGEYWYAHWDTMGLSPGTYFVAATLVDAGGKRSIQQTTTIQLNLAVPADYTTIAKSIDLPLSSDCLLGDFTRYYDTRWAKMRGVLSDEKVLGSGWSHNYNIFLFEYADGTVEIQWGTGAVDLFMVQQGKYTNTGRQSYYPSLTKNPDGSLHAMMRDGTRYVFGTDGQLASVEKPNGRVISFAYGGDGLLANVHDAERGVDIDFEYCKGRLISVVGPDSHVFSYHYTDQGLLGEVIAPDGGVTVYTYSDDGILASAETETGYRLNYEFDGNGRLVGLYKGDEASRVNAVLLERDADRATVTVAGPTDFMTTLKFDSWGNTVEILEGNSRASISRDARGNVQEVRYSDGRSWAYEFDERGNILSIEGATGHRDTFRWDCRNQLIAYETTSGLEWFASYDTSGALRSLGPPSSPTRYENDEMGNCILKVDPLGNQTDYDWGLNGLAAITHPDGVKETFDRDSRGNVLAFVNGRGERVALSYDHRNQMTDKTFQDGTAEHYEYDTDGRMIRVEGRDGDTVEFTYDPYGRRLSESSSLLPATVVYGYDASSSQLAQLTYPDGTALHYRFDPRGLMTELIDDSDGDIFLFAYDDFGRRASTTFPNGVRVEYEYDTSGRISSLSCTHRDVLLHRRVFSYDAAGNIACIQEPNGQYCYEHDALSQLISSSQNGTQGVQYNYDANGNRASVASPGQTTVYVANERGQYTRVGESVYSYDSSGNLISKTTPHNRYTYAYDESNLLVSVASSSGLSITYAYDAIGRRTRRDDDASSVTYLYAGYQVVVELDGSGKRSRRYTWGPRLDELLAVQIADRKYYCHLDRIGTVLGYSDSDGCFYPADALDEFGLPREEGRSDLPDDLPYRFAGRPFDADVGLYYFRARYYSPELGRYISTDPLADILSSGGYAYAHNSPLNGIDPFGTVSLSASLVGPSLGSMFAIPTATTAFRGQPRHFTLDQAFSVVSFAVETVLETACLKMIPSDVAPPALAKGLTSLRTARTSIGHAIADVILSGENPPAVAATGTGIAPPTQDTSGGKL